MLADIEGQVEDTVHDIRRLVYGLRPPALDEFGLYRALQHYAARLDAAGDGLTVTVQESGAVPYELPAAVEVATFRIITEALTNVARHSAARHCVVTLTWKDALEICVDDDGHGMRDDSHPGVGLSAMRERATELGGELRIQSSPAGTSIRARLPIPELP
jgi:signal transduction histidine kinase